MSTEATTSDRILDAAWHLVGSEGAAAASMGRIAQAAGVSRQAVYLHFPSRAALLIAAARREDARAGFIREVVDARSLAPVDGLVALVRAWFRHIPRILPVARALMAAEAAGDEGGQAWRDRFDDLREAVRRAIERLEQTGQLAGGWSVDTAADWVWARIHITSWYHLVVERGWDADELLDRTLRSVLAEVADSGATHPAAQRA
jgi:AcrR family transcriptional regulator